MAAFSFPFYKAPREGLWAEQNKCLFACIHFPVTFCHVPLHLGGISGVIFWDINFFCNAIMRRGSLHFKRLSLAFFFITFSFTGGDRISLLFLEEMVVQIFFLRNPRALCKCRVLILPSLQRRDLLKFF